MIRSPPRSFSEMAPMQSEVTKCHHSVLQSSEDPSRKGKPRPLVLDFECSEEKGRFTDPKIIGEFVVEELNIQRSEIEMIAMTSGSKNTLRVFTCYMEGN